ncbi:hypothetical protein PC9H_005507 [Pleurotus ostreatus]|uniref:EKC/KEOPS complex subunit CGI121 n=1 Tax=Pleurotus ostreatus TaxID=5322 RepID=A0A8H7A016_PLEOS|nr:uncharacterized protein PC9H_005507 [Pleurotus ostreatus]KAF7433549.1 hypothetical protein PC9H_005507 [Pleurotus ostreatus]
METFTNPHFPRNLSVAHVALFAPVNNAKDLRSRIIKAATLDGDEGEQERQAVNFAFIDARLITSRLHLQTAIYQAVMAEAQGALRTKKVHSEIVWILNPTNNITEALRRYGVSDTTRSLLVVRIDGPDLPAERAKKDMDAIISGETVPLDKLQDITEWNTVKKHYKLGQDTAILEAKGDSAREKVLINEIVISSVASKSIAS